MVILRENRQVRDNHSYQFSKSLMIERNVRRVRLCYREFTPQPLVRLSANYACMMQVMIFCNNLAESTFNGSFAIEAPLGRKGTKRAHKCSLVKESEQQD
jgi:hypothetical protein